MAVRAPLSPQAVARYARAYRIGTVLEARGSSQPSINTIYDLKTTQGCFVLRILENRPACDARFEEALLARLRERDLPVPDMLGTGRHGRVMSLGPRRHLSLFRPLKGRELAVFEIGAEHAVQIGELIAAMHVAARGLRRRRRNQVTPARVLRMLDRSLSVTTDPDQRRDLLLCRDELVDFSWGDELPMGIVHGNLVIEKARFEGGQLSGVADFETACTGALLYDLAVALVDWAFLRDQLMLDRVRALVVGYERVRRLRPIEREALFSMCCFVATQQVARLHDEFEARRPLSSRRDYRDYRHYLARLVALQHLGALGFSRRALGQRLRGTSSL